MGGEEAYIMKIRGVNNMPDFIQVRDCNFTLVAYFRADKPQIASLGPLKEKNRPAVTAIMARLPYGQLVKLSTLV